MHKIRRSRERGHADHGWLNSFHTFSFAGYYDPAHMGFRNLRVINQDEIIGGSGFPTHPHRDMEIISYIVEGELAHRDTMGNEAVIRRGEVQYMCAGTGVAHSEFNNHTQNKAHFFQIWIQPEKTNLPPAYGQKSFLTEFETGNLVRVLSKDGRDGSVPINQDATLWVGWLKPQALELPIKNNRHGWIQVVSGKLQVLGETLLSGDAIAISHEERPELTVIDPSEILFFDLA